MDAIDASKLVANILASNLAHYERCRIRTVALDVGKGLFNYFTVVRVFPKGGSPRSSPSIPYAHSVLIEHDIPLKDLPLLIAGSSSPSSIIQAPNGRSVVFGTYLALMHLERHPSETRFSNLPMYEFTAGTASPHVEGADKPMLLSNAPFFADANDAVRRWCEPPNFHDSSDARRGGLLLLMPECRARFGKCSVKDSAMFIDVIHEPSLAGKLRVKGLCVGRTESVPIDELVRADPVRFRLPEGAHTLNLYCLSDSDEALDFQHEHPSWNSGGRRLLPGTGTAGISDEVVERSLRSGEGDLVEFKPFVQLSDTKADEIIDTVVAFANTRGGALIFGVENSLAVTGIERDLTRDYKGQPPSKAIVSYASDLRKLIGDRLNRTPPFDLREASFGGHLLLVLQVERGPETAYFAIGNKEVRVRHGSNNVLAHPDHELPNLVVGKRVPFQSQ